MRNGTALLISSLTIMAAFAVLAVSAHACSGCGGSGGTGSASGTVPGGKPPFTMEFMSCINPQAGDLKAAYPYGTHWIFGESTLRVGSDYVYSKGNDNYVQCYCPVDGEKAFNNVNNGIQSNFVKVSNLTDAQKGDLMRAGWRWLANGADFGLKPEPYLVFNAPFSCGKISCNNIPTTAPIDMTKYGRTNTVIR